MNIIQHMHMRATVFARAGASSRSKGRATAGLIFLSLLSFLLGAIPASATPINFFYGYNLNAVTDNGMTFTGTFSFNPATNTFLNTAQKWAFQLQGASAGVTTSDLNNGVTYRSPGVVSAVAWPNAYPNYATYGEGATATYIDVLQSAGTGLLGWGSSSVDSEVYLEILGLPLSYSDAAGQLTFSSFSQRTPGQDPFSPYFLDDLNGTVSLVPNQPLPAPVPEPASNVLLASGLGMLAGFRWLGDRRRRPAVRRAAR